MRLRERERERLCRIHTCFRILRKEHFDGLVVLLHAERGAPGTRRPGANVNADCTSHHRCQQLRIEPIRRKRWKEKTKKAKEKLDEQLEPPSATKLSSNAHTITPTLSQYSLLFFLFLGGVCLCAAPCLKWSSRRTKWVFGQRKRRHRLINVSYQIFQRSSLFDGKK